MFATYFYMWIYSGVGSIYYGFYRYLHSFVEDFFILIQRINDRAAKRVETNDLLNESVELHLECIRFDYK